jgi:hypothetical protein
MDKFTTLGFVYSSTNWHQINRFLECLGLTLVGMRLRDNPEVRPIRLISCTQILRYVAPWAVTDTDKIIWWVVPNLSWLLRSVSTDMILAQFIIISTSHCPQYIPFIYILILNCGPLEIQAGSGNFYSGGIWLQSRPLYLKVTVIFLAPAN